MKRQILNLGIDSLTYGMGSVITRFIGLFLLPIFTAYLTPGDYGVLALLGLLTMVAHPVFSLGLSAAMGPSYFEGNNPSARNKVVWTAFAINTVSAALLVAFAWLFPVSLGKLVRLPAECAPLVWLTLTGCALTIMATAFTQRVQFEKQAKLYVLVTVATALAAISVSVITVVVMGWGVKGMVIGQLAGNAVTFLAFFLIGLRATLPAVSLATAKALLRLGLPLVPAFAFLFILVHANKYILEWQAGLDAVGVYSIGFNLGNTISIITGGIATAWYPFFMSYMERQSEAKIIFGRVFTYYVFGVGFLCLLFFLAAKPAIQLLTQEAFYGARVVVGFVALANFFQMIFNFFLPGLYFNKEVKYVTIVQGLAALLSLPINYFLINQLGLLGAGIGVAAGSVLMAICMFGWNHFNAIRYPIIAYEWRRVASFVFLAGITMVMYAQVSVTTVFAEIIKSLLVAAFSLVGMLFLLNGRERSMLTEFLHNRFARCESVPRNP